MKKMHKRVLALLMALILMFSCTAFASAAEPESTGSELTYETASVSEDDGIMPLVQVSTPRAFQQLTSPQGGTKTLYDDRFDLGSEAFVTIVIVTECRSQITVNLFGPDDGSIKFTVNSSDQKYFSTSEKLPVGHYYCTVSVPGGAQTTFAFAATDYYYNG